MTPRRPAHPLALPASALSAAAVVLLGLDGAAAQTPPAPGGPEPIRATSTAELAALCGAQPTADGRGAQALAYCHGFLSGAGQYHAAYYAGGGGASAGGTAGTGRATGLFCPPDPPPTLAAAGRAFAEWARANPQHGAERPVDGLLRFAVATYPCPQPTTAAQPGRRGTGGDQASR